MPRGLALVSDLSSLATVGSALHQCYHWLPQRIYYLNIEPIMSQNQYYKPIQSEVQVWIFSNMPVGPALASDPSGLALVGSVPHLLACPNWLGWPCSSITAGCLREFIIWILNSSWVKINIMSQHNLNHRWEYLATCLGSSISIGSVQPSSSWLGPASVSSAPDWLSQPHISVTTTCLRELIIGILNPSLPWPCIS